MMKRLSCIWFAVTNLFLLNAVLLSLPIRAQEVEIEVAGPWSYAADPGDKSRVVLIAPTTAEHEFDIISGGDVSSISVGVEAQFWLL